MAICVTGPYDKAVSEFEDFLKTHLKHPESARRHAKAILRGHDWSASPTVEIGSYYTRDGHPTIYTFAEDDLCMEELSDESL